MGTDSKHGRISGHLRKLGNALVIIMVSTMMIMMVMVMMVMVMMMTMLKCDLDR